MGNLTRICLLLAAVLGVNAAPTETNSTTNKNPHTYGRIVGGVTVSIKNYPYQLSLQIDKSHACGASIINARWAVTAAHCVGSDVTSMTLRAGSSTRGSGGSVYRVIKKIPHTSYNSTTFDYDIALLKVHIPFKFSENVAAIVLHAQNAPLAAGTNTTVSGWGTIVAGTINLPTTLQAVAIPVVSEASCKETYGEDAITPRMLCAGITTGGKDSCQGDSGGPLVTAVGKIKQLVGVVSWGYSCAQPEYPGIYTRIANLNTWIKAHSVF